ncbi:MAG: KpsF/GutQ family sugar-phosphate isomerase [Chlamydiia bacterium]|nr:KpsF/GutQ family sugar-phosphate isomerase [Chlamydiia bacterium]
MLLKLFEQQHELIDAFFEQMDIRQADAMMEAMLRCEGFIFFTGVGKSGVVAKKIATTLISVGTKALYLSPTNSLHGDLGIVAPEDIVIALSKSGESEELIRLAPHVREKGAQLIAVVSKANSRLAELAQLTVLLPLKAELCPFDLAPTTSAAIQMIFGDILTVALMQVRNFSLDDYALNHPAGRIGRRITTRVRDLMHKRTHTPICRSHQRLLEVLPDLSARGCGCMLVVDDKEKLLGIFTDGDLRRGLQTRGGAIVNEPMGNLMTTAPKHIHPDVLAWEAMKAMEEDPSRPVYVLPVVENEKVVGLLRMHDIVQSGL